MFPYVPGIIDSIAPPVVHTGMYLYMHIATEEHNLLL